MIKIGELSSITGVSIQTIRFYEAEGIISPIEVDRWTNYRYYDQSSIERLSQITYLKDLGFSLKEIKDLNEQAIRDKIDDTKLNIVKLQQNIAKLSNIYQDKGEFKMDNFVNDQQVVGKWKKLAVVKSIEDFAKNIFDEQDVFDFNEIYFLPNGEDYWVFSWTKGILRLRGFNDERELPYQIIDGKMFVGIVDRLTKTIDNYAVYEQVDNKAYSRDEIKIKDNTNIPFVDDKRVIGFWKAVDYVRDINTFNPKEKFWEQELLFDKYTFEPNGNLLVTYAQCKQINSINWSKGVVINKGVGTVSEYVIKTIDNKKYMFMQWKSGDYTFGGKVTGYYVFEKMI